MERGRGGKERDKKTEEGGIEEDSHKRRGEGKGEG